MFKVRVGLGERRTKEVRVVRGGSGGSYHSTAYECTELDGWVGFIWEEMRRRRKFL
ncbi:predicted protein [Sclerotinia sclerotiorum 1980 UF-70]|uniref:Uncharacterized protein n=1 Tax=Sclerotinia sclerotiorum (strain ATCC 18683 / 1980 / Ss-1) TaxID=665079 RepID=A7E787_SCLS1|nr:predicted protein [Sclerotinia sclerotiorum 1980 UF-70]EDN96239.1 predicted protein [Sclerotinia sclerotiorum 1980 UF-70]